MQRIANKVVYLFFMALILFMPKEVCATVIDSYAIDNLTKIDKAHTTAEIDISENEIRLPEAARKIVDFWDDESLDYIILGKNGLNEECLFHYSFNGEEMVVNEITTIKNLESPLSAITSSPYPNTVVVTKAEGKYDIKQYSFTGNSMVNNPYLSIMGLESVLTISGREIDLGLLTAEGIAYYGFGGSNMVQIPMMSIEAEKMNSPIDFVLSENSYNSYVLDQDGVKTFMFDGTQMLDVPSLLIAGLTNPRAIDESGNSIGILDENEVKRFMYDGSSYVYLDVLSVKGLTKPKAFAMRNNSYDVIVLDENEVKYFMFDGTKMTYNEALSKEITAINAGSYVDRAVAQSALITADREYSHLRVRANHVLENETGVIWSLSNDGGNTFIKRWKVERNAEGTSGLYKTDDNGDTWILIGTINQASPSENTLDLWTEFILPGKDIVWRAELFTYNNEFTPRIKPDIVVDGNNKPLPPLISLPEACFLTTTPTIEWEFRDNDSGDYQIKYDVEILNRDTSEVIISSPGIISHNTFYRIPTSTVGNQQGPLWNSGTSQYSIRVRTYDSLGIASEWSSGNFCVKAFERPRIKEIVLAPSGQVKPEPGNPASHIVITEGMTKNNLPYTKAGGKVTLLIDTVGIPDSREFEIKFPYKAGESIQEATIESTFTKVNTRGSNYTWEVSFFTESGTEECPDNTVIGGSFKSFYRDGELRYADSIFEALGNELPSEGQHIFGSRFPGRYSEGLFRTRESALTDWTVILQGNKS